MRLHKVRAGYYVSDDGCYSVTRDGTGYVTIDEREGCGVLTGCDDDGWQLAFDFRGRLREDQDAGETLGWFDTKRAAVNYLEWHQTGSV